VVIDHGPGNTPPAGLERLLADERVRLHHARGASRSQAWNLGVRAARGDAVAFLQANDLWAPTHLARLLAFEDAEFAYSASWIVDAERHIVGFQSVPGPDRLAEELLGRNAIGTPSSVIARRALWERAGGFDEWLTVLAPWDLWIRWSRAGVAQMCSTPTVAAQQSAAGPAVRAELRELRRRYGADAKRTGQRFGGARVLGQTPLDGARPP
jgi:glycosyltransferase involved in cell wall biosynthesis